MGFLISSDWVLGEAADLNIHISEGEVLPGIEFIIGLDIYSQSVRRLR
jgi:hypothetical protein